MAILILKIRRHLLVVFILTFPTVAGTFCAVVDFHKVSPFPFVNFYFVAGVVFVLQDRFRWFRMTIVFLGLSLGAYLLVVAIVATDAARLSGLIMHRGALYLFWVIIVITLMMVYYWRVVARSRG